MAKKMKKPKPKKTAAKKKVLQRPRLDRAAIIEECAKLVPTNWCDSLLTGPQADRVPLDGRGVEKLLRGIQDRIRALAAPNGER